MRHPYSPGSFVVVLGMHPTVPLVLRQIHEAGGSVVLVADVDSTTLPDFVHHVAGSPTDEQTVLAARPADARTVLLVAPDDGDMLVAAVLLRHLAPDVPAVAIAQSTKVAQALADLGVARTISTEELLGQTLAKSLEAPHAADVLLGILGGDGYKMEEVPVDEGLVGTRVRDLGDRVDGLVLGIARAGRVLLAVVDDPELAVGDRLVRLVADDRGGR
ncbi:MAG: NAD-binding protein [Actinomycetota bacterium]|nr:NAD-binding protein [Actinomycetota bacterium]